MGVLRRVRNNGALSHHQNRIGPIMSSPNYLNISPMTRILTMLFVLSVFLCACTTSTQQGFAVTSIDHVDLQRYKGMWYEIGSFPMFFQRNCIANTQANYTLEPEGQLGVHNQCLTKDGIDKADGVADIVKGSDNAKLRVSFFRPFWADYWVIGLDTDYRWALVGTPNRRYLWLLSRSKILPRDQLDTALDVARKQGFDINNLRYTTQN